VLISNYNPELLGTADRIIAFREGQLVAHYNKGEVSETELLKTTLGGSEIIPSQEELV